MLMADIKTRVGQGDNPSSGYGGFFSPISRKQSKNTKLTGLTSAKLRLIILYIKYELVLR